MTNMPLYSTAALAAVFIVASAPKANAQYFGSVDEAYNPGEQRRSFDLITNPYPIPAETTTYVDFIFNLPDDLPELFHVTYSEVINSQPDHLHHFALLGCLENIDPASEKTPVSNLRDYKCIVPLGGWAPGADIFGNTDLDTGIVLGQGLGFKALQLNFHYTDGVYADAAETTLKIATDGIRIHYTPVFRPYSSVSKQLVNIIAAPEPLVVPPGESRFFVTRTCTVETNCKDASQGTMNVLKLMLGIGDGDDGESSEGLTCEAVQHLCNVGGDTGSYILRLCPATCGLCGTTAGGGAATASNDQHSSLFRTATYRATAVWYHAHLLGREMYTTLIRGGGADDSSVAPPDTSSTVISPKQAPLTEDLGSREFWIIDNQETIPLDFNVVRDDTILRGTEIRDGDKIQSTCVFDATDRTEDTRFWRGTYDEMCVNSVRVTFETPASLLNGGAEGDEGIAANALDMATQLHLMSFACREDRAADIYSGALTADEDARDIWKDHPIEETEGCTYAVSDFFWLTGLQARNCGDSDEEDAVPQAKDESKDEETNEPPPPPPAAVVSSAPGCCGATNVLPAVSASIVVLASMLW